MSIFNTLRTATEQLDAKHFRYYAYGLIAAVFLFMSLSLYYYHHATAKLAVRIAMINQQRAKTQELLDRFQRVKKQQAEVDELLEQDREFKIGGYFSTVIQQLSLTTNKTREPATSSVLLDNGYTEVQLYASFSNMNMQNIAELLDVLEQKSRIYVKELEIYKPDDANRSVNINIMIATLQAQGETSE